MRAANRVGIGGVIDQLDQLASGPDHEQLAALRDRLETARLRVLVVGEAKRGKSALINALLGREVLPAGVTPLTAVPTTVRQAAAEGIEVSFGEGQSEELPLSSLPDFGTERGNPRNSRNVQAITVGLDVPILASGAGGTARSSRNSCSMATRAPQTGRSRSDPQWRRSRLRVSENLCE
jgi:Dynamin family